MLHVIPKDYLWTDSPYNGYKGHLIHPFCHDLFTSLLSLLSYYTAPSGPPISVTATATSASTVLFTWNPPRLVTNKMASYVTT